MSEKTKPTEETHNMMREYAALKVKVAKLETHIIEFLQGRKATKEDPHSEKWDADVWEDFWLEGDNIRSQLYFEDDASGYRENLT